MKNLFRIAALVLLTLSVSVMPLRALANMNTMDCCRHMSNVQIQDSASVSEANQSSESGCPHQDNCQTSECLTTSSCSTSGLGLTTSDPLSLKSSDLNLFSPVDHLYTSQNTPPLLKPPCKLSL